MSSQGFDVNKSRISDDSLATFLASPITEDIMSVPGIGVANAPKLKEEHIETTFQLLGLFLTLKGIDMTSEQHCDAFWFYLQSLGINGQRSGIVHCIAEKANLLIPGIFQI